MTNLTKAIVTVMFALSLVAHNAIAAGDEAPAEQVESDAVESANPTIEGEDPQLGRIGGEDEVSDEGSEDNKVDAEMIRSAQAALSSQGFKTKADGIMGPNTQNAIMRFQGENGLPQTGDLDSVTLSALGVTENGATSEDMPMDDNSMDMNEEDTTSP